MKPVLLLDVVGLTLRQLGAATPNLEALAARGARSPMGAVLPAVTSTAQATMLTGLDPSEHGAVGNGWYWRDRGEVAFWKQSNAIVQGEKLYERARREDPTFTCAKLFWWWNQGAAVDWSITPKPHYGADGSKVLDVHGAPSDYVRDTVAALGPFPFFDFWGPRAGLPSTEWIAAAAIRTLERQAPSLTLVYLPHLDYDHQRHGPDDPRSRQAVADVDRVVGRLVEAADRAGAETVVVSEYGIEPAARPVHVNLALRRAGWIAVRPGPPRSAIGTTLDTFESRALAVSDHQLAHVYVKDPADLEAVRELCAGLEGVAEVLDADGKRAAGLDHERAGDMVLVAGRGAWFTYYYWLEGEQPPDFAPTVDIHRKPGYDPLEMFTDPALRLPALRVARRLLQKKLGMRYLMDVIPARPTDAALVGGTHGRLPDDPQDGPLFLATRACALPGDAPGEPYAMTSVPERILALMRRE